MIRHTHRKTSRRHYRAALTAAALLAAAPSARATDGIWFGASGTAWSSPANWVGGVPTAPGDTAYFPYATTLQVNVDADVTLSSLAVDSYLTLAGPGSLTLAELHADRTTITVNVPLTLLPGARLGGTHDFSTSQTGATFNFAGPLSASGPVALTGWGARTLAGQNANLTGPLAIDRGAVDLTSALPNVSAIDLRAAATLKISTTAGESPVRDRVNDAAPISLGGGLLSFNAAATPGATESLGAVTLTGGFNQLSVATTTTGPQPTLSIASLTREGSATLNMVARPASATDPGERIFVRSAPTSNAGILGGWAVGRDYATGTTADLDFLTYDDATGLRALGTAGRTSSLATATAADNVLIATAPAGLLAADATVNSLVLRNPTAASPWTLDLAGHTLNLASGGLLTSTAATLTNGRVTAGGKSPVPAELFVRGPIAADIVDNPAGGSVSVVIANESGSNALTGHNTYTGATILNRGSLNVSATTLPPTTDLELNGGFFSVAGNSTATVASFTIRGSTSVNSGINSVLRADAYHLEAGYIFGLSFVGSAPLTKTSPDEATVVGNSPNFTGPVTVQDGDLLVHNTRSATDRPLGTGRVTVNAGRLVVWAGTALDNPLTLAGGALAAYGQPDVTQPAFGSYYGGPIDVTANVALQADSATLAMLRIGGPLNIAPGKTVTTSGSRGVFILGPVTVGTGSTINVRSGFFGMNSPGHDALNLRAQDASLTFYAGTRLASLDLTRATATLLSGNQVLSLHALTLADTAKLDLTDGALLLDYSETSPLPQLRADLAANRLTSSLKSPTRTLGYAEAADVLTFSSGTATFLGQSVDPTTFLVRLTLPGDANLDGTVNFDDLLALAKNYNATDQPWNHGDFDASGTVNFDDLLLLAKNYNAALPATAIPGASPTFSADLATAFAQVPEPSAALPLALTACVLSLRRRRRSLPT